MKNRYTENEIIKNICESAQLYQKNLLNKNIMFVFENNNTLSFIETLFKDYNFKHLTGISYKKSSKQFFCDCINRKISPKNIIFEKEKIPFTYLKMEVLTSAMSINKIAKRLGDYDYNKEKLEIEKVIGNVRLCLGFSNILNNGRRTRYYYPKTLLKDKINSNSCNTYKIVAILSKEKNKTLYNEITYLSKDLLLSNLYNDIKFLDYDNLYSTNKDYQKQIDNFKNKKII